jgi:hypothetical protein
MVWEAMFSHGRLELVGHRSFFQQEIVLKACLAQLFNIFCLVRFVLVHYKRAGATSEITPDLLTNTTASSFFLTPPPPPFRELKGKLHSTATTDDTPTK